MKRIDLRTLTDKLEIILPNGARLIYIPDNATNYKPLSASNIKALFEEFYSQQRVYTGKRAGTLRNYRQTFAQFTDWMRVSGITLIEPDHWRQYYASLLARNLSVYTIRNHYRDLTVFVTWLMDNHHIETNPLRNVSPPEPPKNTPPKAITDDGITRMLGATTTLRDSVLLLFFIDTGCRIGEAAALTWHDIDFDTSTARVVDGKNHKFRHLFLSEPVMALLHQYYNTVPNAPYNRIWHGRRGPLTANGLRQIFRRIAGRAGIDENANPHAWRHAFGRYATIDGMPTGTLQQLLGHSSIETTQIYLNLDTDALKTAHDQHTPAQRIIDQIQKNG